MRHLKYYTCALTITYCVVELLSAATLYFLREADDADHFPVTTLSKRHVRIIHDFLEREEPYTTLDPQLGWTIRKNGRFGDHTANSLGIRSSREYSFQPPEAVVRVAAFGDSFTHGSEVANDQAWTALMEETGHDLEVLNFGVGAYGTDQAYLRYRELGKKFDPDVVFIGFMTENIFRNVNTFRPFYNRETGFPLAKPRFRTQDGKLQLIPPMLTRADHYRALLDRPEEILNQLGQHDYYYQRRHGSGMLEWSPTARAFKSLVAALDETSRYDIIVDGMYNENSEAFKVTKLSLKAFYDEVIEEGAIPVVIVFPDREALRGYQDRRKSYYAPLLEYFGHAGMAYVDLMHALAPHRIDDVIGYHYTPLGNALVAKRLLAEVSETDISRQLRRSGE